MSHLRSFLQARFTAGGQAKSPAGTALTDTARQHAGQRVILCTESAPDIIEAILRGHEPDGLSLEKLRKDLPVRWEEQRRAWLRH